MSLKYIRDYYKVPAKRGMRVTVDGKPGVITASARGPYIMVRFDGDKFSRAAHPTWRVEYIPTRPAAPDGTRGGE